MKKEQPPGPRMTAVAVMDPALPEKARKLLREAEKHPRRYSGGQESPLWVAAPVAFRGGIGAAGAAMVWWFTGSVQVYDPKTDDLPSASDVIDRTLQTLLDALHSGISTFWPFAAAGILLITGNRAWETAGYNATLRDLTVAKKRCVQPAELAEDARTLVARAQQAKKTVLTSSVHRFDLIDRQRNTMALPQQEWEIAEALREYSRLVRAEPKQRQGSKVAALLDNRRKALKTSLDGIERRVTALELYADQVAEADRCYRELQQIQRLNEGSADVLELLARTAGDDLAVAEIEGMTEEAAAVAATFTTTLESAKEAAVIALPAVGKTTDPITTRGPDQ